MQVNGYTMGPRADLRRADLTGANLRGANIPVRLVLLGESVKGRRRWAWLDADGTLAYIRCGCRSFASMDEARAHFLADDYNGESAGRLEEIRAALDYWAAMIEARARDFARRVLEAMEKEDG